MRSECLKKPDVILLFWLSIEGSPIAGEKIWEMPMHDSYWKGMKSEVADMRNTGGRFG